MNNFVGIHWADYIHIFKARRTFYITINLIIIVSCNVARKVVRYLLGLLRQVSVIETNAFIARESGCDMRRAPLSDRFVSNCHITPQLCKAC